MAGATPKTSWFSLDWPVYEIRETFFSYLAENQYAKLSSTPVIPIDDPKVPLIHTCLNRLKGALNGTGSHRTCFSLRCIVTSSDDVIEHFRSDATYHRFTEILGSWSSGDYFKEEAIGLLHSLLSKKYGLPESIIHATYFSGDTSSGLSPDNESKTALQKCIGEERILPSMSKFNRQADGVLSPLQAKHIITGINLQCLAAILQKKESLYELDDYDNIIDCISSRAGEEFDSYSGKVGEADTDGVDTAYRLLADHMRMISVTNAPGSQLGKCVMFRLVTNVNNYNISVWLVC
ncbi:hypothetical protein PAHAL_3G263200 [Panicum hallii]|uniref:alanine--tRNA ligase n=1 Tax=Panicum hallii TaxID=206008 RepID=A0A2T8KJD6_9POAL|nr:hypothetical protein PAHAL_3G263200 [Panicum hallii]